MLRPLVTFVLAIGIGNCQELPNAPRASKKEMSNPQLRELVVEARTELNVPAFSSYGRPVCDADGDLCFHAGAAANVIQIFEVSHTGESGALFKLPPEMSDQQNFGGFTVTPSGTPYALSETQDGLRARVMSACSLGRASCYGR